MKKLNLLFILSIVLSTVSIEAQKSIYTEEELGFNPGELIILEAPDNETIEPLVLPAFRGKLRLGIPISYKNTSGKWEDSKARQTKKFLTNTFDSSLKTLYDLMAIDVTRNTINVTKMSDVYRPNRGYLSNKNYTDNIAEIYWIGQFQRIAGHTLTPEAFKKYLAPEIRIQPYRPITKYDRGNRYKRGQATWGGRSSDFSKLRIAKEFINNELPKYLEWSKNLPNEAYEVGRINLGNYNFDLEGFLVRLRAVGPATMDKEAERILFDIKQSNTIKTRGTFTLLKMAPEEAEAFVKKIEDKRNGRTLYYVYQVKLAIQKPKENVQNPYKFNFASVLIQTPVSKKIEFFLDEALTEKVFEFESGN